MIQCKNSEKKIVSGLYNMKLLECLKSRFKNRYKIEYVDDWFTEKTYFILYKRVCFIWWPMNKPQNYHYYWENRIRAFDDLSHISLQTNLVDFREINKYPTNWYIYRSEGIIQERLFRELDDIKNEFAEYLI